MYIKKIPAIQKQGLTIIEIIVVAAIIGIVSLIVIADYRDFQKKTVLENLAQDVAITIRLAQSYGLNVQTEGGSDFDASYGIRFGGVPTSQYTLFKDSDRSLSGGYGLAFGGTNVETYNLGYGFDITSVCADGPGGTDCVGAGISYLDILFDRPKPDPIFTSSNGATYSSATIIISGLSGDFKTITVGATGLIRVQ